MNARPRILYLAPCWPNEPSYGSTVRAVGIARALRELGDVHFVIAGLDNGGPPPLSPDGAEFPVDRYFSLQQVPRGGFLSRVRSALDPHTVDPYGQYVDAAGAAWLWQHISAFDLVWLHNLRTPNAFRRWVWPNSVMDLDDVPSTFLRTLSNNGGTLSERMRARVRTHLVSRSERLLSERFTVVTVCSEADRAYLQLPGPVHVIPNGVEAPAQEPVRRPAAPPRIGFIGNFEYGPNAEAVRWFVDKCWTRIKEQVPQAQLRLVGKLTDGSLKPTGPDIHGLGYVEDPNSEIATWSVMIAPIRCGAGTRVKIAKAFSQKCPVVSTTLGAFGYDVTNGQELYLADDASEFAHGCVRLMQEPAKAEAMAERAWKRFVNEWTWEALAPRVWAAAEDCLRQKSPDEIRSVGVH